MSNRFVADNARAIVQYLHDSGIDPDAYLAPPSKRLDGGCGDPDCCGQHPGHDAAGRPMLSVVTSLSNSALHRLARRLGLPIRP